MQQKVIENEATLLNWLEQVPFVPGQIIALELYSLDDEHFSPEKIEPGKAVNHSIVLPAIVTSVKLSVDSFPLYTVRTLWRTNSLELVGYIELSVSSPWRYIKTPPTVDSIPKWFLETIDKLVEDGEETVFGIPINELCYIHKNEEGELVFVYKWDK